MALKEWEIKKLKNTLTEWEDILEYNEGVLKSKDAPEDSKKWAREYIKRGKSDITKIKAELKKEGLM